ncbi:MAG: Wzz/FepE/Etk N-terminal domain-containing protein, partial [Frankia sp.]
MRLSRALPAGLLDAGCHSLSTLAVGVYAARELSTSELGAYALFFNAFVLATVIPMQLILVPAEIATLSAAPTRRLGLFRQVGRLGVPATVGAAAVASALAWILAKAPPSVLVPLAVSTVACGAVSPLQDHLRRLLHMSGKSGHAAAVSVIQLACVIAALIGLKWLGVNPLWRPFGALALANVASILVALAILAELRGSTVAAHPLARHIRTGRWLVTVEIATAGATLLSSALITRLASPVALGHAEAARIVGQPLFVLAVGLMAALTPYSMTAATTRDRATANRFARPYMLTITGIGVLYAVFTATHWSGNPAGAFVPQAYVVAGLVPATVVAFVLTGLPLMARAELSGAGWVHSLPRVAILGGLLQCAVAASAMWIGGYARPLSQGAFAVVLIAGYARARRRMYRTPAGTPDDAPATPVALAIGRRAAARLSSPRLAHSPASEAAAAKPGRTVAAEQDEGPGLVPSLWRRRWLLGATLLCGVLAGAVGATFQPNGYEAVARVLPTPAVVGTTPSQADPSRQILDEQAIMSSTMVLDGAAARYGSGMTGATARAHVHITASQESDLITVRVFEHTPAAATRLATAVLQSYDGVQAGATRQRTSQIQGRLGVESAALQARIAQLEARQSTDPGDSALGVELAAVTSQYHDIVVQQSQLTLDAVESVGTGGAASVDVSTRRVQPNQLRMALLGGTLGIAFGAALILILDAPRHRGRRHVLAGTRLGPAGHPAGVASVPAWPGATGAPVPPQLRPFRWFTPALLVILTGYMFFGRSFAYVGIPGTSIFIGEMVFALGVIEAVKARRVIRARVVMSPPFRVLAVFIALCAVRLLVDLPKYRMGAVRDA